MTKLLNLSGIKFRTLGKSEGDCGSLLIRMGYWDAAKEIAEENKSNFKEMKIKTVVTSCPACIETFVNDYRRLFQIDLTKDLGLKFLHSSQILEQLINEGKLSPPKLNLKVAYHDPCYLGRHLQIYNPPRKVIRSIPGVDLMEPPQSRALSSCCGAGGSQSFKFMHEEEALNQALRRVKQFEEIGVDSIVTACPFCTMNLREGAERLEKKINVYELSTLLMKAMGDKGSKPEPS
jgi:Fe-S oxidoreductase